MQGLTFSLNKNWKKIDQKFFFFLPQMGLQGPVALPCHPPAGRRLIRVAMELEPSSWGSQGDSPPPTVPQDPGFLSPLQHPPTPQPSLAGPLSCSFAGSFLLPAGTCPGRNGAYPDPIRMLALLLPGARGLSPRGRFLGLVLPWWRGWQRRHRSTGHAPTSPNPHSKCHPWHPVPWPSAEPQSGRDILGWASQQLGGQRACPDLGGPPLSARVPGRPPYSPSLLSCWKQPPAVYINMFVTDVKIQTFFCLIKMFKLELAACLWISGFC